MRPVFYNDILYSVAGQVPVSELLSSALSGKCDKQEKQENLQVAAARE